MFCFLLPVPLSSLLKPPDHFLRYLEKAEKYLGLLPLATSGALFLTLNVSTLRITIQSLPTPFLLLESRCTDPHRERPITLAGQLISGVVVRFLTLPRSLLAMVTDQGSSNDIGCSLILECPI